MAEEAEKKSDCNTAELPLIVKIKPGTAAEKSMKFRLPASYATRPVEEIVKYALGLKDDDGLKREDIRVQDRVKVEMKDKYGVSVNGTSIKGSEKIGDYFKAAKTGKGTDYLEAEIIIASRQEGAGLDDILYTV